jgi:hypothetical protein
MSKLDEPVTIHFKEDSIPGLRRGVMTEKSKAQIKALVLEHLLQTDDHFTREMLEKRMEAL